MCDLEPSPCFVLQSQLEYPDKDAVMSYNGFGFQLNFTVRQVSWKKT